MQLNATGLALIESFEALVLFTYDDAYYPPRPARVDDLIRGTLTIGYGHTGDDASIGATCDEAQADAWLAVDVQETVDDLNQLINSVLTPNQFSALVSLAFNIGTSNFAGSSALHLINGGSLADVPAHIKLWNKTRIKGRGLVVSDGLVRRRSAEVALWLQV